MNDFTEFCAVIGGAALAAVLLTGAFAGGIALLDYHISAEETVNAINRECGTDYVKFDYFRVGSSTMQQLCQIRQQRIEIN